MSGQISRLVPNPARSTGDFPRTLSATGLFASVADHVPAPGLIPYSVIAPQWCDGATRTATWAFRTTRRIEFETLTYPQPAPGAPPGWKFPDGTVLVETISLELEQGNSTEPPSTGDENSASRAPGRRRRRRRSILAGLHLPVERPANRRRVARRPQRARPHVYHPRFRRARRPAATDLAFPQPHRMHRLPQHGGQVCARRANAANESGSRLRRHGCQPTSHARASEHLHEAAARAPRRIVAVGRLPLRSARILAAGPARICTPTARTVIASGAAATPISSCWPRSICRR